MNSYNYYLKTHYIIIPFEENLSSIHPIPQYDTNFNQINFFPFYVKSMFVRKNGTLVIGFIDGTINFYDPFSFQIILTYHLEGEVRLEVIENLKYSEEKIIVFDSAGAVYELILTEDNQLKKGKEISLQKCTNIKELNNGTLLFFNARNHIMHHCEKDNYTIIQTFNKVSSIRSITKEGYKSMNSSGFLCRIFILFSAAGEGILTRSAGDTARAGRTPHRHPRRCRPSGTGSSDAGGCAACRPDTGGIPSRSPARRHGGTPRQTAGSESAPVPCRAAAGCPCQNPHRVRAVRS